MNPIEMMVAAQQAAGAQRNPNVGLLRSLPQPAMQAGAGIMGSSAGIDRDSMLKDYLRTQGIDPEKLTPEQLQSYSKDFGVMQALSSAPARGLQKLEKGIDSIQDQIQKLPERKDQLINLFQMMGK